MSRCAIRDKGRVIVSQRVDHRPTALPSNIVPTMLIIPNLMTDLTTDLDGLLVMAHLILSRVRLRNKTLFWEIPLALNYFGCGFMSKTTVNRPILCHNTTKIILEDLSYTGPGATPLVSFTRISIFSAPRTILPANLLYFNANLRYDKQCT